jgi:hypothetical protein
MPGAGHLEVRLVKSLRLIALLFAATLSTAALSSACASSEIDPRDGKQTEADAQGHDTYQGDIWTGPSDVGSVDAVSDAGPGDAGGDGGSDDGGGGRDADGSNDSGTNDSGTSDTGQDTGTSDSGQDTSTSDTGPGVGCTSDNDCAVGARCHDRESVCVPSCCNNVTHQDSFTAVSYSHNRFDIDVTDVGEPAIVFVDGDSDTIKYAQSLNNQWLSQDIDTISRSTSTNVRLSLASDGTPHVIVGHYDFLKHYWRSTSGWQSENLLPTSPDAISVGYVDIAVDANDGVHMVALLGYGSEVLYNKQTAQGVRSEEYLIHPAPNNPVWTNIGVTSDGRPIASFQIGLDKNIVIAEKGTGGTWSYEILGQDISQVHGLAVDPNDQPVVAYRKGTNDGLRVARRTGQSWQHELIVADPDHGYSPDIAVDSLGDPHLVYMAQGAGQYDNPMYYARWNGAQWEHHQLTSVARAFYPRVVVDASRTPHAVVYDPTSDTISYLKVQ